MMLEDVSIQDCKLIQEELVKKMVQLGDIYEEKGNKGKKYLIRDLTNNLRQRVFIVLEDLDRKNRKNIMIEELHRCYRKVGHKELDISSNNGWNFIINYVKLKLEARVGTVIEVKGKYQELIIEENPLRAYRLCNTKEKDIIKSMLDQGERIKMYIDEKNDISDYLFIETMLCTEVKKVKQLNEEKVKKIVMKMKLLGWV